MDTDDELFEYERLAEQALYDARVSVDGEPSRLLAERLLTEAAALQADDTEALEGLIALYDAFEQLSSPCERLALADRMAAMVESGEAGSPAFIPFLYGEDDVSLIAHAAFHLILLAPGEHPLERGVQFVVELLEEAEDDSLRLGLLLGLLRLADPAALPRMQGVWRYLEPLPWPQLGRLLADAPNKLTVLFILDWLADPEDEQALGLAYALRLLGAEADARLDEVHWARREDSLIPVNAESVTVGEWAREIRARISELPLEKLHWCLLKLDGSWLLEDS